MAVIRYKNQSSWTEERFPFLKPLFLFDFKCLNIISWVLQGFFGGLRTMILTGSGSEGSRAACTMAGSRPLSEGTSWSLQLPAQEGGTSVAALKKGKQQRSPHSSWGMGTSKACFVPHVPWTDCPSYQIVSRICQCYQTHRAYFDLWPRLTASISRGRMEAWRAVELFWGFSSVTADF